MMRYLCVRLSARFRVRLSARFCVCLLIAAVCLPIVLSGAAAAQEQAVALNQKVTTTIQGCRSPLPVQVPVITWGGDIATIYANGNQAVTAPGSLFAQQSLQFKLVREDVFAKQLEAYMSCQSPFLRGTAGMLNMAAELTESDPRTQMVVVYQLTWSAGGDALVAKEGIKAPRDLKGKTVAVQAYGPHIDYLGKVLADGGLTMNDVKIYWVKDLTATDNSPGAALHKNNVDAAMVISPDAMALTSGGTIGTGAEDSVKGASIMLTTKSANRVIADLYAVRKDYYDAHQQEIAKFVEALFVAEEKVRELFKAGDKSSDYKPMLAASAKMLLDSPEALKDTEGLYADAQFAGWKGNVDFFAQSNYPRSFKKLNDEIQPVLRMIGLLSKQVPLNAAGWTYDKMKGKLGNVVQAEVQRFDTEEVAKVVSRKQQQGTLSDAGLFAFEVYFKPNQDDFPADLYTEAFDKAINLASTYGGAVITVEGHSDPLGYLKKKKEGVGSVVLTRIEQAAKNLSLTRANAVRDSLLKYGKGKGVSLDPSQFAIVGHGITRPSTGRCGQDPCAPKNQQEWLNNMRVEFRLVPIEAEENVFKPL